MTPARSAFADPGNAEHQIKAGSKIVVSAQLPGNVAYLGEPPCLQPGDVTKHQASQGGLLDVLEPRLAALDVILGLLKEGQTFGQLNQARIGCISDPIDRCRAGRDQRRIQNITSQMHPAECLDLDRL